MVYFSKSPKKRGLTQKIDSHTLKSCDIKKVIGMMQAISSMTGYVITWAMELYSIMMALGSFAVFGVLLLVVVIATMIWWICRKGGEDDDSGDGDNGPDDDPDDPDDNPTPEGGCSWQCRFRGVGAGNFV